MLTELLSVPPADREQFREWLTFAMVAPRQAGAGTNHRKSLVAYFDTLLARRRTNPTDDLLSTVAAADNLSTEEARNQLGVILLGGLSTTYLITNTVWSLVETDAVDAVTGDVTKLERAIEETLRYRSPIQAHSRYAITERELGDVTIESGDKLCVWYSAANHDPTVFSDPAQFLVDRQPNPHVAFGYGTHYCLGATLARLTAKVALQTFFDRIDNIDIMTDRFESTESMLVYGPSSMPVTVW